MARVTAVSLRSRAREAMLSAGGRGFMRFLPPGGPLFATDALRRADDDMRAALLTAFLQAGFACEERDGLLLLTPDDAALCGMTYDGCMAIDWEAACHDAQALGRRWLRKEKQPLTPDGRQLIVEALRICWLGDEGLDALRARAAVMQRRGDTSGMREAGAALLNGCDERRNPE